MKRRFQQFGIVFLIRFKVICRFSVLHTGIQIPSKPVKALLRLSDALKCSDLSNTKVQEKSFVREEISHSFRNKSIRHSHRRAQHILNVANKPFTDLL